MTVTLKMIPDDRMSIGETIAYVKSAEAMEVPSQYGATRTLLHLQLQVPDKQLGMTLSKKADIPVNFREDGTFVSMLRAFDALPKIGEDIDLTFLANRIVKVTVVQKIAGDRSYRNIVALVPFHGDIPPLLQDWLHQQQETQRLSESLFDEESEDVFSDEPGVEDEADANTIDTDSPAKLTEQSKKTMTPPTSKISTGAPRRKKLLNPAKKMPVAHDELGDL